MFKLIHVENSTAKGNMTDYELGKKVEIWQHCKEESAYFIFCDRRWYNLYVDSHTLDLTNGISFEKLNCRIVSREVRKSGVVQANLDDHRDEAIMMHVDKIRKLNVKYVALGGLLLPEISKLIGEFLIDLTSQDVIQCKYWFRY